jgi:hypothetical protein
MKNIMKNTITKEQLIKKLDAEIIVEFSSEDDVVTIWWSDKRQKFFLEFNGKILVTSTKINKVVNELNRLAIEYNINLE